MRPDLRPPPPRSRGPRRRLAGLLAGLALVGCEPADPLAAIRQQQASGDLAGSIEPLREVLAERPDDPEANFLYGRALALAQQPGLATWSLRKAMADPAWLVPAGTQLAFAALGARDFNEVVAVTGRILEQEPDNTAALLMRANAYAHWKKDPEQALADANRVLELDPNLLEAFEPRILALVDLGRREEAGEALAEAGRRMAALPERAGGMAWHCVTTAVFAQEAGEIERARETFVRCLDEHPSSMDALQSAVSFYDSIGERDRSLEILRAAVAAAPNARGLRIELAERLRVQGEIDEAEALLSDAAQPENPASATAWIDLAKLRQVMGEHAAAADALERAIELGREAGPVPPQIEFMYADALVLAGRLDDAQQVAEGLSVPAQRHMIRARVAQSRRDPALALEEFDEALRLWPDNPWARYYAALAAEELGDFDRAIEEYRYSIRISAGATDARARAAALLVAEGRPLLAVQLLAVKADQEPLPLEGQLLSLRLSGLTGDLKRVHASLRRLGKIHPAWVGRAAAQAAEGVAMRAGPAAAVAMLVGEAGVDLTDPRQAAALRALVELAHQAGDPAAADAALNAAIGAHPQSGVFQEIRGLQLELSGAPREAVRAAYERALELEPRNSRTLSGLGRLALGDAPEQALGWFDRAAAADPSDPGAKLGAARALAANGQTDRAAERLDGLLLAHPYQAEAAAERTRLDLERGVATPRTLERAQRAARFGGGAEAFELLSRVHALRGESEPAERASERARALREPAPSEG
jgi:tetratricopeptide (TPR) repeat protein